MNDLDKATEEYVEEGVDYFVPQFVGMNIEDLKQLASDSFQEGWFKSREGLRHLVDVVWGHIYEDESVPATYVADELIKKAYGDSK